MDCTTCAPASVYVRGDGAGHFVAWRDLAIVRMPADIFPDINIPIVTAIWTYAGVSPEEMAEMITTRCERGFTTGVNDIEHMESQSLAGLGVIKLFFPSRREDGSGDGADLRRSRNRFWRCCRRAFTPPNVIRYNAASVPILQLGLSSDTLERAGRCTTSATTSSARSSPTSRAPAFRCPMAASRGRSWWTSIRRRCTRTGFRPAMFPPR